MGIVQIIKGILHPSKASPSNRHLSYSSLDAWRVGEKLPDNWTKYPDQKQCDMWWKEYAELQQHLWQKHISSLTIEEQNQFKIGSHPSQSHKYAHLAQPFCKLLEEDLLRDGIQGSVSLGFYHLDRIVLSVCLSEMPAQGIPPSPNLYRGFEIKFIKKSEPKL